MDLDQARELFDLATPPTREELDRKRSELLAVWHPARYANLTNNPRKYMLMYKKGEAMTKQVEAAYAVLSAWLSSNHVNRRS
jgi:hypothetical protein